MRVKAVAHRWLAFRSIVDLLGKIYLFMNTEVIFQKNLLALLPIKAQLFMEYYV